MKRLSWPGVIVIAGSSILSWLSALPVVSPAGQKRGVVEGERPPQGGVPTAASIAAMQLHDWSPRSPAALGRQERDIFAFRRRAVKPAPLPAPAAGLLDSGGSGRQSLVLFKLIGFAEDAGPDGTVRTAIISGQGQLYLVKEGETVAWIYRVGTMSSDSVELSDSTGGPTVRLTLK